MKFSLLVFVLTLFVLNACCGQLSGDPAPGRSPGPPELRTTTNQLSSDITTIIASTTPHIHVADTKQPDTTNVDTTDDVQNKSRFSEQQVQQQQQQPSSPQLPPPSSPNDSVVNNRHREHIRKSHGNAAATHHKLIEKLGKTASKTGTHFALPKKKKK